MKKVSTISDSNIVYGLMIWLILFVTACQLPNNEQKKVFYINSYHQGYGSSDDVLDGIIHVLDGKVDYRIFYMDTKRNNDRAFIKLKIREAFGEIQNYSPDVIIASDDNAVKYIIEPFIKSHQIPVIFCGVNWTADQYILPKELVTGMLEVLPIRETVELVRKSFPFIETLTVISENTTSELKNKEAMGQIFEELGLHVNYFMVDDFEAWKTAFLKANNQSDLIYLPTNGAIKQWDKGEAGRFVTAHIKKPVITCDDFMMPYAVFGLTKVASEQGIWAAQTALRILDGEAPGSIPVTQNTQHKTWINPALAEKIGFRVSNELYETAEKIEN